MSLNPWSSPVLGLQDLVLFNVRDQTLGHILPMELQPWPLPVLLFSLKDLCSCVLHALFPNEIETCCFHPEGFGETGSCCVGQENLEFLGSITPPMPTFQVPGLQSSTVVAQQYLFQSYFRVGCSDTGLQYQQCGSEESEVQSQAELHSETLSLTKDVYPLPNCF